MRVMMIRSIDAMRNGNRSEDKRGRGSEIVRVDYGRKEGRKSKGNGERRISYRYRICVLVLRESCYGGTKGRKEGEFVIVICRLTQCVRGMITVG